MNTEYAKNESQGSEIPTPKETDKTIEEVVESLQDNVQRLEDRIRLLEERVYPVPT